MKAVVCTKYGPPEVLRIQEVKKPEPGSNQILIKLFASTVSAADFRIRSFTVPPSFWLPARLALGIVRPRRAILGMDFAGEVEAVGAGVKGYKCGDSVYGITGEYFGGHAQYLCITEKMKGVGISRKPANLDYEEAAAIPFGGTTALYFLREADIQKGQRVLINGASGSVGTASVQLAKYYGADVTAVCSTGNIALVSSLGADRVIDYTREDFTQNGETYDVVFDTVGKASLSRCIDSTAPNGVFLHSVSTPAVMMQMKIAAARTGKKMVGGGPALNDSDLALLKELVEADHLKPVIDRRYPMDQVVDAHRYVATGHKKGNVVLSIEH